MDSRPGTRRLHPQFPIAGAALAAAVMLAVVSPTGVASARIATAAPSAGATAHTSVIAQRVVTFQDGPHHWSIDQRALDPAAEATAWTAPAPEFVIAARGSVVVTAGPDTYLIGAGEAVYVPSGAAATAAAVGDSDAATYVIHVVPGDPTGAPNEVGAAFTPGAGAHDVDLLAMVLDAGQSAEVPASPAGPILAFVTSGSAAANDDPLATGEAASVDGSVTFTNASDGQAVAVALSIGAAFDGGTPPVNDDSGNDDSGNEDGDDAGDGGSPTTTDSTTSTTTSTSTTEHPTTTTPVDTDNDGLGDSEEAAAGTNPASADSDGDSLSDGNEVQQYGTNPLTTDSDSDELSDPEEVNQYGTDPSDNDSDDDGLSDGQEVRQVGSNPLKVDTDGDGLTDVQELAFETSPTNPDTDGDGTNDKDEARNGSDPTDANA